MKLAAILKFKPVFFFIYIFIDGGIFYHKKDYFAQTFLPIINNH